MSSGPFDYELRRSARRRTLAIEVHADLRVIVRAPARADDRFIAGRVAERRQWISRTLERFRRLGHQRVGPLRYVDGEIHYYLGEARTLRLARSRRMGVTISPEELRVSLPGEPAPGRVRCALEAWYREQAMAMAAAIVVQRFDFFRERGHQVPVIRMRNMRTRWGSLAGGRRMTLNLALIRAPRECLEYVVVHELCHLEHRGHGRAFYRLLDSLLPDWRDRRRRLEGVMAGYGGAGSGAAAR